MRQPGTHGEGYKAAERGHKEAENINIVPPGCAESKSGADYDYDGY